MKYFEVKYFQPATRNRSDQYRYISAQHCYTNCYQRSSLSENPDAIWLTMIGSEGIFPFVNGICEKFLGYYRAEIVREIASDRAMEADRFEEVAPLN